MASITEWRWHRKESVNLKITTKITQFEQRKKHRVGKRMNSTSKMSGTKPKDLVFATGGQKKRRKKIQCSKIYLIKRTEKFSSLVKNINLPIQEDRINPKKLMPKYIIIKLMKIEDKKKSLKPLEKNWHITYRGNNNFKWLQNSYQDSWRVGLSGTTWGAREIKTTTLSTWSF